MYEADLLKSMRRVAILVCIINRIAAWFPGKRCIMFSKGETEVKV